MWLWCGGHTEVRSVPGDLELVCNEPVQSRGR